MKEDLPQIKNLEKMVKELTEEVVKMDSYAPSNNNSTNIFINFEERRKAKQEAQKPTPKKLNTYDTELYEVPSAEVIFTEDIVLEQEIKNLRAKLDGVLSKLSAEKAFENYDKIKQLTLEKEKMEKELSILVEKYKKIPMSKKLKNKTVYALNFVMTSLFKQISNETSLPSLQIKQPSWKINLQKLNSINKEIDQLLALKIPYGEVEEKYEKLAQTLNVAMGLHNNINKELNFK